MAKYKKFKEPSVRFELTWDKSAGLQNQCNQPLCEKGILTFYATVVHCL